VGARRLIAVSLLLVPLLTSSAIAQNPEAPAASQPAPGDSDRPVSWKLLPSNLLSDQKRIWLYPLRLNHPRNWIAPALILGTTVLLSAEADSREASYFRRTTAFHGFDNVFTGQATSLGMIALPASLYAAGLIRRDSRMKNTVLLAGEAVLDSELLTVVCKDIDRRRLPSSVPPQQGFSDTWFESKGSWVRGSGSFPSGHTIAAFSIATVIARRYGNHRWVPYAAYGAAALVGFSRLPLLSHYTSDVFMGGVLGYSIARFAVLR
jgi:membrane-associated phospholipid phosphatase